MTVTLGIVMAGCGPLSGWTDSGIPKALDTDVLLRTAGTQQNITLSRVGSSTGRTASSTETERQFHATIATGTPGQLVATYRTAVKREIESRGGTIHSTGESVGGGGDVGDFSYGYTWGRNEGIVRVYSFPNSNGQLKVISFCYEHRR